LYLTSFLLLSTIALVAWMGIPPLLGIAIAVREIALILFQPSLLGLPLSTPTAFIPAAGFLIGPVPIVRTKVLAAIVTLQSPKRHSVSLFG
jgi:hypothetical protein